MSILATGVLAAGCDDTATVGIAPGSGAGAVAPVIEDAAVQSAAHEQETADMSDEEFTPKVVKTDAEWKAQLTDMQYRVARLGETERAFTGKYWDEKTPGVYHCIGCGAELFSSDTKFHSGCGWPSFYQGIADGRITEKIDKSLGMIRTEIVCTACGAHLGHVFNDGPEPTGLRYCVNSASLQLEPEEEAE